MYFSVGSQHLKNKRPIKKKSETPVETMFVIHVEEK